MTENWKLELAEIVDACGSGMRFPRDLSRGLRGGADGAVNYFKPGMMIPAVRCNCGQLVVQMFHDVDGGLHTCANMEPSA